MKKVLISLLIFSLGISVKSFAQDKKFAITFGIGPVLTNYVKPSIVNSIDNFNEDPIGIITLQGELYLNESFSMFGEFSTNSYAGNSSSYSSGDYSRMQVEYKSLSLNGRWNMLNKKFMPYIDGGLGVSAGTHYWNTTDDSPVLGVIGQLGIGAKLYFGKFGIFADTKSCLVFNTKRINGEQKTAPAYAVNLLQQNFRFGICLGF